MKKFVLGILIALTGATCAAAADLYYKAPVAAPVYNWTGFYIGGNAGGAWGNFDPRTVTVYSDDGWFVPTDIPAIDRVGIQSSKPAGFTGGFEAGYNWQSRNFVFGVEGDIGALSLSSGVRSGALYPGYPYTFTVTSNISTTWLATVRGRLGYAVNNWLFFVTGGAALTDLRGNFAFSDTFSDALGIAPGNPNAREISLLLRYQGWVCNRRWRRGGIMGQLECQGRVSLRQFRHRFDEQQQSDSLLAAAPLPSH